MTVFGIGERVKFKDWDIGCEGTVIPMSHDDYFFGREGYYNIKWDKHMVAEVKHWTILVSVDNYNDFRDRIQDRLG